MKVVLADADAERLAWAESHMRGEGEVLSVVTQVSQRESMVHLATETSRRFGDVHFLFNNAGVTGGGRAWDTTSLDWEWVLSVNLYGVIYGIQAFLPGMLAHGAPGYVVNTASAVALLDSHPSAPYHVSKHAVLALSQNLRASLKRTSVRVSCLCPSSVRTRILESDRRRPEPLPPGSAEKKRWRNHVRLMQEQIDGGLDPDVFSEIVMKGLQQRRFLIVSEPQLKTQARQSWTQLWTDEC